MSETDDFNSRWRLALASLGRNVLHFQRLESQLKVLTLFCDFESSFSGIATNHKLRLDKIRTKTFGGLVSELHQCLYEKPIEPKVSKATGEALLTLGFRVDADPKFVSKQKGKLQDLVDERNRLIHHDLADFDPTSSESCQRWISRLDEQNQRILEQLYVAQQFVSHCREAFGKILSTMETDEWKCRVGSHSTPSKNAKTIANRLGLRKSGDIRHD